MSPPTCSGTKPATLFFLQGGDGAHGDAHKQKTWVRSCLILQDTVQTNLLCSWQVSLCAQKSLFLHSPLPRNQTALASPCSSKGKFHRNTSSFVPGASLCAHTEGGHSNSDPLRVPTPWDKARLATYTAAINLSPAVAAQSPAQLLVSS